MRSLFTKSLFALLTLAMIPATPLLGGAASDLGISSLADLGTAEAAFIRRGKLKQKAVVGYKVIVVVGEDEADNEVDTVEVSFNPSPGDPVPDSSTVTLSLRKVKPNGNKRYVYADLTFSEDAVGSTIETVVTMKDAAGGTVGTPETLMLETEDDGDASVRSVVIRQLDATNFLLKTVVVGDDDDDVDRVDITITDYVGNAAIPESVSVTSFSGTDGKKVFKMSTLTFEDPGTVPDEVYSLLVSLIDAEGETLSTEEIDVVVEGLDIAN